MGFDIGKLTEYLGGASTALTGVSTAMDLIPPLVTAGKMTIEQGREVWDYLYETFGGMGGAPGSKGTFDKAMAKFRALSELADEAAAHYENGPPE